MKFRIRGNSVQVLRIEKDSQGKSNRTRLGSFNLKNYKLTEKLKTATNEEELNEIELWIEKNKSMEMLKKELMAKTLSENIREAQDWITKAKNSEAKEITEDILDAFKSFKQTAKKEGLI